MATRFINEVGKIYGKLSVIEYAGTSNTPAGGAQFNCMCECGNKCIVKGADLRAKRVMSCGCLHIANALLQLKNSNCPNLIDETGNQYGNLTVLSLNHTNQSGNAYWLCQCVCGRQRVVVGVELRRGTIVSCRSCATKSKGEKQIQNILRDNDIQYEEQYVFDDLRGKNNRRLPFDLAVLHKDATIWCLIEYQGEQHYKDIDYFKNTESLEIRQAVDRKKKQYCEQHNIKLIIIPYWDYDKLNKEYLFKLLYSDTQQND